MACREAIPWEDEKYWSEEFHIRLIALDVVVKEFEVTDGKAVPVVIEICPHASACVMMKPARRWNILGIRMAAPMPVEPARTAYVKSIRKPRIGRKTLWRIFL